MKHDLNNNDRAIVLLSGGIDSAACAYFYKEQGFLVESLFINYGQPAAIKEERAAGEIASYLSIPIKQLSLSGACHKVKTEVGGRNAFLLFAALMEFSGSSGTIGIGVHAGTTYYDCTKDFLSQTQKLFDGYNAGCIQIGAPFVSWSKYDIWKYYRQTGMPEHLTYSCELGLQQPCGSCLSCQDLEKLYACKEH